MRAALAIDGSISAMSGGVSDLQEHRELLDFGVSEDRQLLYEVQRDGSILFFWWFAAARSQASPGCERMRRTHKGKERET